MLDSSTTKQFIKHIRDTDETIRVAAVLSRHRAAPGEYDWLTRGPEPSSALPDNNTALEPSALESLKRLADHATDEAEKRHRQETLTMAILETLAQPASEIPMETDLQETRFEMPSIPKSDSGSRRTPTSYKNCTLSPLVLLLSAVLENTRYIGPRAIPKNIYVHDDILRQLPLDMRYTSGEEFDGYLPFRVFGDNVRIPILSAKKALDVDLPRDVVWCSN